LVCSEWEELSGDEAEAVLQEEAAFKSAVDNFEWNACQCLFDSHVEPTVSNNITYMGNKYGFFVPVRARAAPYSDAKVANRDGRDFGWEIAHGALRDARRFPSTRL
jgi:hypothetical protein